MDFGIHVNTAVEHVEFSTDSFRMEYNSIKNIIQNFKQKPTMGYSIERERMYRDTEFSGYVWTRTLNTGQEMRLELWSNSAQNVQSGWPQSPFKTETLNFFYAGKRVAHFRVKNGGVVNQNIQNPNLLLMFKIV